ncbi:hypothetical protein DVR12_05395 [Chitinophaga silvatica]|uniref:Outer membrane protein beta-barrel domain-containing protein n=1 Tax=Chitinophaga silvatica TaxID=2282649 RepID=A0A3E1YDS4_9BACT|nr:hypothetical protein [Chitinophaga silvatica]RFS24639.1 hypothetical protein DVR12_05395 [Chitinophaga silvatica]
MNFRHFCTRLLIASLAVIPLATRAQRKVNLVQAGGLGGFFSHQFTGFNFFNYEARLNYALTPASSISLSGRLISGVGENDYRQDKRPIDSILHRGKPLGNLSFGFSGLVSYNFGNAANSYSYKKFGGALGVGYNYKNGWRFVDSTTYWKGSEIIVSGICVDAKFNFPVFNTSWTLDANYTYNLFNKNPDIKGMFSFALLYNIHVPIHEPKRKSRHQLKKEKYNKFI